MAFVRLTLLLAIGLSASLACARTWRVERDGSGDYTVIQAAVDVAASGDTIRIGPGRYNEGRMVTCPGWTEFIRVLVTQAELTLVGSGPETIIGQEGAWDLSQGNHKGIAAWLDWEVQSVTIDGLCIENARDGIYTSRATTTVRNCTFRSNYYSLTALESDRVLVEDCQFIDQPRNGTHVFVWNSGDCNIRDSMFILPEDSEWSTSHVSITGTDHCSIDRCEFFEGSSGVEVSYGGTSYLRHCEFQGQSNLAIWVGPGQALEVTDCAFRRVRTMTNFGESYSVLLARRCVFDEVVDCTLRIQRPGLIDIQDCDLDRGLLGVVWMDDSCESSPAVVDMRNNYWGTDSIDSIQAWIRDSRDSDQACGTVLYQPFEGGSTPTENVSWGHVKSLFR
jgi:hypothetical protein